jgi:hypothetical protein
MEANELLRQRTPVLGELFRLPLCALVLFSGAALAAPLAAQTRVVESGIAGAAFPLAASDWSADADGSKGATLDLAASLAGSECETREAFAWKAGEASAADNVRNRTESALQTAGWSLDQVSHTAEGQRILVARRGSDRFVMVWRPEETEIGLLMCQIEPAPPPILPEEPATATAAAPPPDASPGATVEPPLAPIAETDGLKGALGPETEPAPARAETPMPPPAMAEAPAQNATTDSAANLWLRLLAVGLLILGGVGLIIRDFRARARSVEWQWPTASATVERGWVEEDERDDAAGNTVTTYMPMLRYRYRVDGEEFQGGNIGLDDRPLPSAEAAVRSLAKYPDFATIDVRYDPEDPSFAVIEAMRPPPGREFYFGLGAILLAIGVLVAHLL